MGRTGRIGSGLNFMKWWVKITHVSWSWSRRKFPDSGICRLGAITSPREPVFQAAWCGPFGPHSHQLNVYKSSITATGEDHHHGPWAQELPFYLHCHVLFPFSSSPVPFFSRVDNDTSLLSHSTFFFFIKNYIININKYHDNYLYSLRTTNTILLISGYDTIKIL